VGLTDNEEVGVRLTINGQEVFSSKAKLAQESIKGIGDEAERTNLKTRASAGSMDVFSGAASGLSTAAGYAVTALKWTGAAFGVAGLAATIYGVKTAATFEQTNIAFTTMLGSQSAATSFLNDIQTFAQQTPFNFSGLIQTSERMLALGFQTKEIIPDLTAIGNAASALGTGQDGIDRTVLALGQMRNSAHLNAQDMMQLTNANINGWQYLADAAHKSIAQVREDAQKGIIDPRQAADVILKGLADDPKFKGMMDAQSKTFIGQLSNLEDSLQRKMREGFTPLMEDMKREIPLVSRLADSAIVSLASFTSNLVTGAQELNAAYKQGGITGVLDKIGQWTGTGRLFSTLWHQISDDSSNLAKILRNSVLPGIQDVARAFGPEFMMVLGTVHEILKWMADHPTAARLIFDGIAMSIIGYKLVGLITGVADAIFALEGKLLSAGGAAITFGNEVASGVSVADAAAAAGGAPSAAQAAKQAGTAATIGSIGGKVLKGAGVAALAYAGYEGGKALDKYIQGTGSNWMDKVFGEGGSGDADKKAMHERNLYDRAHGQPDTYPGMANGGTVSTGGWSWVGERGPELLHLNAGAQVLPLTNGQRQSAGSVVFQDGAIRVSGADVLNAQATADILVQQIKDKLARN